MRILGINISHDASVALVEDGVVLEFYEEARFKKIKHYDPYTWISGEHTGKVFECIRANIDVSTVDKVVFSSFDRREGSGSRVADLDIIDRVSKDLGVPLEDVVYEIGHHIHHAHCANYFSEFDEAVCIVLDGGGAKIYEDLPYHQEIESIYTIKGNVAQLKFVHMSDIRLRDPSDPSSRLNYRIKGVDVVASSDPSSGMLFSHLCKTLGLGHGSEGKLMGLAPYGEAELYPGGHRCTPQGLAYELQNRTFIDTVAIIEKAISYSNTNNVILSGGYALNCTNNYKYIEHFPDVNFFIDPNAYDAGTAIGAALWMYYDNI